MSILLPAHEDYVRALPRQHRAQLLGSLLLYVFRGTQQSDLREKFAQLGLHDFDFLGWRRHLHRNGALLRDGKLWVFSRIVDHARPKGLDLTRIDLALLTVALEYPPLVRRLRYLHRIEKRAPLTPAELDLFIQNVLTSEDLLSYTRKYIRKKMSFLRTSYGTTFADLESDLRSWGAYSLLRSYPRFDDLGHGIAIAKTTVKRRGVNLMKTLTSQKQNQLITAADGSCERTTVSLSNIADSAGQFLTADGTFIHRSLLVVGLDGLSPSASTVSWDMHRSLETLSTGDFLKEKQKEFLRLMLGKHSDAFSEFIGQPNEDACETLSYELYTKQVCRYLSVLPETAKRFLSNLRPHLGGSPT